MIKYFELFEQQEAFYKNTEGTDFSGTVEAFKNEIVGLQVVNNEKNDPKRNQAEQQKARNSDIYVRLLNLGSNMSADKLCAARQEILMQEGVTLTFLNALQQIISVEESKMKGDTNPRNAPFNEKRLPKITNLLGTVNAAIASKTGTTPTTEVINNR